MHLFKGIQDTFENFEWNFRDIGIQRFLDFWRYLFKMLYDFKDTFQNNFSDTGYWGNPLPGPHLEI